MAARRLTRRPSWIAAVLVALAALMLFAGQASASPGHYRILVVTGDGSPGSLPTQLAAFADVSVVDQFDAGSSAGSTPTAAQLEAYDMVISTSSGTYKDHVSYGNALADYVDSGGVVVQYAYDNWDGGDSPNGPTGRFASGGYQPFTPGPNPNTSKTLGSFDAGNPLMQGVTALGSSFETNPTLAPGATLVAHWNDGTDLIAYKGRVVSVSAYLGNSGVSGNFDRLTINAVRWLGRRTLSVSKNGTGAGTVTSNPSGINCGAACTADFTYQQLVTLTANAAPGSTFAGWSGGGCSGTSTCHVTMSAAQAVTATFNALPPVVSHASESNSVFSVSANPKLVTTARRHRHVGTTFSYTLDKPASGRFDFTQPARGRRVNGRCGAPNRHNQHKHKCTRTVIRGSLSFAGHAGVNTVKFYGWLSRHKKLKPGKYTLVITATTPGVGSTSQKLKFTIVR